jgi:hypothetical protein
LSAISLYFCPINLIGDNPFFMTDGHSAGPDRNDHDGEFNPETMNIRIYLWVSHPSTKKWDLLPDSFDTPSIHRLYIPARNSISYGPSSSGKSRHVIICVPVFLSQKPAGWRWCSVR